MDVDEEGELVVVEAKVLDADVALLVADVEAIDALDARDLLGEVDQLGLQHRAAELPSLAVATTDEGMQVPPELQLDVLAQAVARPDRPPDQHDPQRQVLVPRADDVE